MKKFRLIELGDNFPKKLETYASFDEAAVAMRNLMAVNHSFYRIEEFEESIMDRVKSYEEACEVKNIAKQNLLLYPKHIAALIALETITAALNEGWKPDWEDETQIKWFPELYKFHENEHSNGSWEANGTRHFTRRAYIPARLAFKSRELAEYAAKQFAELYKQLLIEAF